MRSIRAIKDITARQLMLGITIFGLCFLVIIGISLFVKALPIIKEKSLWTLLTTSDWRPFKGDFGFLPFILSTIYVSLIAIAIALPLSLFTSIYLNTYSSVKIRKFFQPFIDVLSGIPSVIYGVWGTLTIVPFISEVIAPRVVDYSSGYSMLAGGIVLAVMILPLLISILLEVFQSVPREMIDASLQLGATKWQTIKKVILKKSFPGILAAVVLSVSRAFGETIAVLMVCGNFAQLPLGLFDSCYPLPALIANNYGEMMSMPSYESALMLAAFLLFIIILIFNAISRFSLVQIEKRYYI
ncbi:MAG TPA: phosphate ABC transporter permease subunit PstC [Bacteroidales bacterium]|jgi:phosphate transport system permease protein|nr:phosphate ABC transporter permease subunit PstC [Bacteroidales bacterium]